MPMESAVPVPVEGVGLLLTAAALFSKFQAVMVVCAFAPGTSTMSPAVAMIVELRIWDDFICVVVFG